jgi:hypothetical protein
MSLKASVGPLDRASRYRPVFQLLQRRDLRRAEDRFGVGGLAQALQVGGRDVVDVQRQDLEGQLGVALLSAARQRVSVASSTFG